MRLLDLFCGAGGCSVGYHRAGFDDITGVDINPMPRYPFRFVRADALEYLAEHGHEYDVIHASPPCQAHTQLAAIWRSKGDDYDNRHPDLVPRTRQMLQVAGKPYVIENVLGAPLLNPVELTGPMFGLMTIRPRLFECSFDVPFFLMSPPCARTGKLGIKPLHGEYITVAGHFSDVKYARYAMGIDWMTRDELSQAIPPAYTRWIGERLLESLREMVQP